MVLGEANQKLKEELETIKRRLSFGGDPHSTPRSSATTSASKDVEGPKKSASEARVVQLFWATSDAKVPLGYSN